MVFAQICRGSDSNSRLSRREPVDVPMVRHAHSLGTNNAGTQPGTTQQQPEMIQEGLHHRLHAIPVHSPTPCADLDAHDMATVPLPGGN